MRYFLNKLLFSLLVCTTFLNICTDESVAQVAGPIPMSPEAVEAYDRHMIGYCQRRGILGSLLDIVEIVTMPLTIAWRTELALFSSAFTIDVCYTLGRENARYQEAIETGDFSELTDEELMELADILAECFCDSLDPGHGASSVEPTKPYPGEVFPLP